ncbi:MAG: VOC family protein, partial [Phycisphaerales bacterium]|nr:VOC family protein [Phycisphaerales bacterium]
MSDESHLGPLHHVGVAVRNIESAAADFTAAFGAVAESAIVVDEAQAARILFMTMHGARIELLQPHGESSHLWGIVNRGIGVYHTCHETTNMEKTLEHLEANGARIISPPKPAVAF